MKDANAPIYIVEANDSDCDNEDDFNPHDLSPGFIAFLHELQVRAVHSPYHRDLLNSLQTRLAHARATCPPV